MPAPPRTQSGYVWASAFASVVAVLVFAPLAFGGAEPWARSVVAVLSYTAMVLAVAGLARAGSLRELAVPAAVPVLLGVVLVALQLVELPAGILQAVSPRAAEVHAGAAQAYSQGAEGAFVSLYPHATRGALIVLTGHLALFLAAYAVAATPRDAARLAGVVLAVGFGVALFGIVQNLAGTRHLYWLRPPRYGGAIFGPFVSRNQFAAYAGVCFFMGVALLLARRAVAAEQGGGWRRAVGRSAGGLHLDFLITFATALVGASVLWSLSRGGIVAALAGLAAAAAALGLTGAAPRRGAFGVTLGVLVVACVAYLGWQPVLGRLATVRDQSIAPQMAWRWTMVRDACRMGADFPLSGTGAGTFLSVYPHYRTLPTRAVTDSPHNEYAHVFAEAGVPGALLLAAFLALVGVAAVRGLRGQVRPFGRPFTAGAVGAFVMLGCHSLVDFPMRSPAVAAAAMVAAALLLRAAQFSRTDEDAPPDGAGRHTPLLVGAALLGWVLACDAAIDPLRGTLEGRLIRRDGLRAAESPAAALAFLEASERALAAHSPGDAGLHQDLADVALAAALAADPVRGTALGDRSLRLRMAAARAEPMNAEHPFRIATHHLKWERADLAWVHAERACELLPREPWVRVYLAEAFAAYGQPDLGARFLDDAERLAREQNMAEVVDLIAETRVRLAEPEAGDAQ